MTGKNWTSKQREWTELVKPETKQRAALALRMKIQGKSVREIAAKIELSQSRIYELLRKKV